MAAVKRKEKQEEFGGETPMVSPVMRGVRKLSKAINIILTDRGLYESAKKRLDSVYNGARSKIKSMFKRK
ncbi:MAG: hypothetical protein WC759_00180 [Candidatus Micrarchaeia archaeon]|jgi:hypothetical protein